MLDSGSVIREYNSAMSGASAPASFNTLTTPTGPSRTCVRLFRAMNFVRTVERALDQDEIMAERDCLAAAFEIMHDVALELNNISRHNGPLPKEDEETAQD